MVGDLTRRPVACGRSVELLLGHAVECFQDDSIAVAVLADQPRPFVRVHLSSHGAAHGAADRNRTRNLLFTKQLLCQLSYGGASKERTAAPVSEPVPQTERSSGSDLLPFCPRRYGSVV